MYRTALYAVNFVRHSQQFVLTLWARLDVRPYANKFSATQSEFDSIDSLMINLLLRNLMLRAQRKRSCRWLTLRCPTETTTIASGLRVRNNRNISIDWVVGFDQMQIVCVSILFGFLVSSIECRIYWSSLPFACSGRSNRLFLVIYGNVLVFALMVATTENTHQITKSNETQWKLFRNGSRPGVDCTHTAIAQ